MNGNSSGARRVMLVDDDADDRKYFLEAVQEIDENIECTTAKDGEEAIKLLRNETLSLPQCIFLDLRMPRINGRQCLVELKNDARLKNIPVIVYTTSREEQDSEDLQNMGAVRFISKPVNTEEIYYVVSQALEELEA